MAKGRKNKKKGAKVPPPAPPAVVEVPTAPAAESPPAVVEVPTAPAAEAPPAVVEVPTAPVAEAPTGTAEEAVLTPHQIKAAEAIEARLKRVAEKRARHLELETKKEEMRLLKRKRKAENIALQEENSKRKKEKKVQVAAERLERETTARLEKEKKEAIKAQAAAERLERETTARLEKAQCSATVVLDSAAVLAHIQQLAGPEAKVQNRPLPASMNVRFPTAKAAQAFLQKSAECAPVSLKLTTRPHPHPARMLLFPRVEGLGESRSVALPLLRAALEAIPLPFAFIECYGKKLAVQFHTDAEALGALTRFQKDGFLVNDVNVAPTMTMGIP